MSLKRIFFCALCGIFYGLAIGCAFAIIDSIYWLYLGRNLFLWGIICLAIMMIGFCLAGDWCWQRQKYVGKWG